MICYVCISVLGKPTSNLCSFSKTTPYEPKYLGELKQPIRENCLLRKQSTKHGRFILCAEQNSVEVFNDDRIGQGPTSVLGHRVSAPG